MLSTIAPAGEPSWPDVPQTMVVTPLMTDVPGRAQQYGQRRKTGQNHDREIVNIIIVMSFLLLWLLWLLLKTVRTVPAYCCTLLFCMLVRKPGQTRNCIQASLPAGMATLPEEPEPK